jgi:beta-N-acetylhexosaminidase
MRSAPFLLAVALTLSAAPAFAQSLEEMAGQMIVVGFGGDDVTDPSVEKLAAEIKSSGIGGVMYLKVNVKSRAAVEAMNKAFVAAAPNGLKPFITLDQEGGMVERLTSAVGFDEVPNAETVAGKYTPAEAETVYEKMADGVAAWGFNVNFAPVVDLNVNPNNQVIAKFGRAFSAKPDAVADYAEAVVAAHHKAGLVTALKHFPGHGSSTADSHEGYVDITKTWSPDELSPYSKMITDGYADFVMVGHLIDKNYSDQPASLAPEWIDGVLRTDLGFTGVVISDDLEMGAIRQHYDLKETVTRAVRAGVDVLLFSNTAKPRASLPDEIRAILVAEAAADPAFKARIEESYKRIVALKARIGH